MTLQEAIEKSFTVKWQVGICSDGEQCWCRTIEPEEPILYKDEGFVESYYVVRSGRMSKKTAEYFVKIHNKTCNTNEE
jgi:hypothetical protein